MPTSRAPRALPWLFLASTCLTGCAAPARDGSDTAQVEATARRWSELDHDARMAVMSTEVMPAARRLFQGFDAERYSSVSCGTCHGEASAARHEYAMPNPDLYPLFPTGTPQQAAMVQEHPEMVRFMHNHLLPEMQSILGADAYDPETQTGFSCFSCHPRGE
ncbi:MAG: hypothetical protein IPL19_23660 [Sandaracinaceae bacterium]|nr:hypothetical protein [Sandaracinaceae bacterium]MBK8587817.1 hypothetical protein [Sandaracinaceae bacterium]MBP7681447.1 hypothetical protein [Deltaproteobacteria bacterium]